MERVLEDEFAYNMIMSSRMQGISCDTVAERTRGWIELVQWASKAPFVADYVNSTLCETNSSGIKSENWELMRKYCVLLCKNDVAAKSAEL